MKVEFKKLGINGEGIGFINRKPVFCDGVLPEETAEVEIIEEKPKYAMARLKRLITKSPDRIESPSPLEQAHGCPLFIWITKNNYVTNKTFLNKRYLNTEM